MFSKHTKAWMMTITTIKFKVTYNSSQSRLSFTDVGFIYNSMTNDMYVSIPGTRELFNNKITIYPKTYRYIFKLRSNRKEYVRKENLLLEKLKGPK